MYYYNVSCIEHCDIKKNALGHKIVSLNDKLVHRPIEFINPRLVLILNPIPIQTIRIISIPFKPPPFP